MAAVALRSKIYEHIVKQEVGGCLKKGLSSAVLA